MGIYNENSNTVTQKKSALKEGAGQQVGIYKKSALKEQVGIYKKISINSKCLVTN